MPRRRGSLRGRLGAALVIMAIGGTAGAIAPVIDDYRSSLRFMRDGCRVIRVLDGDTLDLACGRTPVFRARIEGYDAPEIFSASCAAEQQAGENARLALTTALLESRRTEVARLGEDKYGRSLVDMRLDGRRVATMMVGAGHGRRYFGGLRSGWCG